MEDRLVAPTLVSLSKLPHPLPPNKWVQASKTFAIPEAEALPLGIAQHNALFHPHNAVFRAPGYHRAVAALREFPEAIADAWSAAAVLGVREFTDGATVFLAVKGRVRTQKEDFDPIMRRLRQPEHFQHAERCLPPADALVQCLLTLNRGQHSWRCALVPDMTPLDVRSVQLIDCFRRRLDLPPERIIDAAAGRLNHRRIRRLIRLSNPGAESPPETTLRLIAGHLGLQLIPQVPVVVGPTIITRLDLGCPKRKIGLMYDGAHHWNKTQREKDAWINAALEYHGWRVLRISDRMLYNTGELIRLLHKVFGG